MNYTKILIISPFLFYASCLENLRADEWGILDHHLNETVLVDRNSISSNGYYVDGSIKIRKDVDEGEYGQRHKFSHIDVEVDCIKKKIHIEHFIQSTEESWWNGNDGKNDINYASDLLRPHEQKIIYRFCDNLK